MRRLALVWFLLAATPSTLAQHVHTGREGARLLPLPKEEGVFHFLIFGDRTGGPREGVRVLEQAVRDANLLGPDLVLTVGDLIEGYNETPQWLAQMKEYRAVMDRLDCPWYPVAGNHDVYWRGNGRPPAGQHERDYEAHFGPLWYAFGHKNAGFVVLYSDEGDQNDGSKGFQQARHTQMSRTQLDWLRSALEKLADKEHVFVFLHHPRWLANRYPGSNWDDVHARLKEAGNVSAVFAGHIHRMNYTGVRDGIEYFALATTGGHLSAELPGAGFLHHMNLVTVRKGRVTVGSLPVGAVIDPKTFTAEHLAAIDRLRNLRPIATSGPIDVDRRAGCLGVHTIEVVNPTDRSIEVNALLEADDGGLWTFAPDHVHVELGPGQKRRVELAYAREPIGFLRFTRPRLALQVDYLGDGARISLPRRSSPLALRLTEVPANAFDPIPPGALELVGRGACLRVDSTALRLPDGPFTVEAWLRPTLLRGRRALIAKTESSEFALFVSDGQPTFSVHVGGAYVEARGEKGALPTGQWQHLAGVFDGRELRLYLDGERIAARPASGQRGLNRQSLYIGADPDARGRPNSFFAGHVDEVRISRGARYGQRSFKPQRRHEPDPDTALLLHLDRDLGPFAPDHSPERAHAERVGPARCVRLDQIPRKL